MLHNIVTFDEQDSLFFFKTKFLNYHFLIFLLLSNIFFSKIYGQQKYYLINHKNLFSEISKKLPDKPFQGYIEVIKQDLSKECYFSKYTNAFTKQKEFFLNVLKEIDNYITTSEIGDYRKCVYQYILDNLNKGLKYVEKLLEVKIKLSQCEIDISEANNHFMKIWRELFYKFNKKYKVKKSLLFGRNRKMPNINDSPFDSNNFECIQNTPKMFCEFISYLLYRANTIVCPSGVLCPRNKTDIKQIVATLFETFRREYADFGKWCANFTIIDYLQTGEEDKKNTINPREEERHHHSE
ncbi:MAG: hypothetical protein ACK4NF_06340 [Planctomycetota bacterium]